MGTLAEALEVLAAGGVVAAPTETLVGLLADATKPHAVARVVEIKERASHLPIAAIAGSVELAASLATSFDGKTRKLAEAHWPGPLTVLVDAQPWVPSSMVKDGSVGVRVPGESMAAELAARYGAPLTATSANLSGLPAVANTEELDAVVRTRVDYVLEGACPGGLPSTVVDARGGAPVVLRPGPIILT